MGDMASTDRPCLAWQGSQCEPPTPEQVHLASRSRKGYWRMSGNSILQRALTNHRLHETGVPDLRALWIVRHYGPLARV